MTPNPLLIRVGTPILLAPKVDTEATEGQGRAELGNVESRVGWKLSGQNRYGVEGVRNQPWVSPQRPAEGAGSGLRWPELEQPGCDPRGGDRDAARTLETDFCPGCSDCSRLRGTAAPARLQGRGCLDLSGRGLAPARPARAPDARSCRANPEPGGCDWLRPASLARPRPAAPGTNPARATAAPPLDSLGSGLGPRPQSPWGGRARGMRD